MAILNVVVTCVLFYVRVCFVGEVDINVFFQ